MNQNRNSKLSTLTLALGCALALCAAAPLRAQAESTESANISNVTAATVSSVESKKFDLPINAGNWKVGGGFGATKSATYSNVAIYPRVEYFVFDHLALGAEVYLTWNDSDFSYRSISPLVAYYLPVSDQAAVFLRQMATFASGTYYEKSTVGGRTSLGYSYFLTPNVALTPTLNAEYGEEQSSRVSLEGEFSIHF